MRRPKDGDVFEVDVGEDLGKMVGVLARKKGLVYMFPAEAQGLRAGEAIYVGMVGSQGFADGTWLIRGPLSGFTHEAWPVPKFGRIGEGRNVWRVTRDDSLRSIDREQVSQEEAARLVPDRISGSDAALVHFRRALREHQSRQAQTQHHHAA